MHALLKHIKLKTRPSNPWYTDTIHAARVERRKLERRWVKSQLEIDKQIYSSKCKSVAFLIETTKAIYYEQVCQEQNISKSWSQF